MRRSALIALPLALPAALLLATSALTAQDRPAMPTSPPGTADVNRITAGTYAPDASHTLIGWRVNHFGFNDYFGQFGSATGTLVLNPANAAASTVDITIPVNSLSAASSGLVTHLLSPDFFAAEANPTAHFVSHHVIINGTAATIHGDLTLRGTTQPVTLEVQFTGAGTNPFNRKETVGFHGTTTIQRSAFGIGYGIPMVSDRVDLTISVAFEKQ
jgi:polyisoprenoid-binding protein YceI